MFGGIVAGKGTVTEISRTRGAAIRLGVDIAVLGRRPARGASVSVAGVCLTVVRTAGRRAWFDVIGETIARTTLGSLRTGDSVNVEGALRVGDEVGGHFVEGHVQGVGTVARTVRRRDETRLVIRAPRDVLATLAPKGYVAVDGASLTVAALTRTTFTVALIPETLARTTLGAARAGTRVNLEGDPIGRHVARWLSVLRTR
jgi:riboflavin synthase